MNAAAPALLAAHDLSVRFGGVLAVNRVSFEVRRGEVFTLIGPNGAGKTTVFNLISRIYTPTSGRIEYDGIVLDPAAHTVTLDGAPVELGAKEFQLLQVLLLNSGLVLSRGQLEQHLYSWDDETGSNTVEVYIHHLRRKFGRDLVRTIRGVGYLVPKLRA